MKSLGKQMTLTMYRMEDTERVRMKLREDRRREVREKAERYVRCQRSFSFYFYLREERIETMKEERLERNQRWRERKYGSENLSTSQTEVLSEQEERKQKNREWRQKREERQTLEAGGGLYSEVPHDEVRPVRLEHQILAELMCPYCQEEMGPPGTLIYQCGEGHNLCGKCRAREDMESCPQCLTAFTGRNIALERLALTLFSHCQAGGMQEYVSRSFVFTASQDQVNLDRTEGGLHDTSRDVSDIESLLLDVEGETLRIQ